ncbi:SNF2-related domain-containing protein [Heterostelium album PN500]|uniref:SNF2-related domain-containing protein n=1 Tax=Heterostelium pallidum (strain ATCC 26659 / Pp 5 / PN500) TaxID=670386 RepID=D3B2V3_HETP5|nr:SNF2-related domain-containing protein [Heterostelium album PN500]EFA83651.1 SNF2-related domain-containing protein [Heterostelium album PN500]|eukprot:XP_020435768.1 SNF2-related domain-containing protein [Heterostelium album PN500]
MKRSLAPSLLFEKKKQKLENLQQIEKLIEQQQNLLSGADAAPKRGAKKAAAAIKPINHLDLYSMVLKKSEEAEEKNEETNNNSAPVAVEEENRKGRNVVLLSNSKPIYYLANYKSTSRIDDEGLAILEVAYDAVTILSMDGKQIGRSGLTRMGATDYEDDEGGGSGGGGGKTQKVLIKKKEVFFQEDISMTIGSKWCKIISSVSAEDYNNGTIFLKTDAIIANKKKKEEEHQVKKLKFRLSAAAKPKGFVVPYKGVDRTKKLTKPLHNPYAPNAFVLYMPKDQLNGEIPVVMDPMLGNKLRPHQRVGIQFMFDCLLGLGGFKDGNGCILADDMGLGKTIQAISIMWTLLKQGIRGEPTCQRAIIVAPTGLVGNWVKELKKWLGEGIKSIHIGKSTPTGRAKLAQLETGDADVLVISYDQLKIWINDLIKIDMIGLVICDEGHRLKNAETKSTQAVNMLPTKRRVILSGTPIQNNLMEFYAMVNFVNPGVLKSVPMFNNVYNGPILASRSPDATPEEKRVGRERSLMLTEITGKFILRRTAAINTQYLPKKTEYTVFCKLSPLQKTIYLKLLEIIKGRGYQTFTGALPLITSLKKLSNCPELVYTPPSAKEDDKEEEKAEDVSSVIHGLFPKEFNTKVSQPQYSGKLQFIDTLMQQIRNKTKDRVVVISNYTQTLSVLARLCNERGYPFFQLDGSTPSDKRQVLVDKFNDPSSPQFVFLLSSKAGGIGLNLIGANHLILVDPDWNPANDAQAMARVWREGQKKVVSIYRTLSTGTIEEKIYQRQITKMALSVSVVEGDSDNAPSFDTKDLKDIFNLRDDTLCDTHDMLGRICDCGAPARNKDVKSAERQGMAISELATYKHYHDMSKIPDPILSFAAKNNCTFIFANDKPPVVKERKKKEDEVEIEDTPTEANFVVEDDEDLSSSDGEYQAEDDE